MCEVLYFDSTACAQRVNNPQRIRRFRQAENQYTATTDGDGDVTAVRHTGLHWARGLIQS